MPVWSVAWLTWLVGLVGVLLSGLPAVLAAEQDRSSEWLYFVGLQQGQWQVFVRPLHEADFVVVPTVSEPREIYFSGRQDRLWYLDATGQLRRRYAGKDEVLLTGREQQSYAQPVVDDLSGQVFLVYMPTGVSSQADIVAWQQGRVSPVVRQLSSQFEPFVHQHWLYFGNVHCTLDCGRIIQEVWRKNLLSGESEQVTLSGHITRQPVVDAAGAWLYFSTNRRGRYHIGRQSLTTAGYELLTEGNVTDSDPAVDRQGNVYFIRRAAGKTRLLQRQPDGTLSVVALPAGVQDIRHLRINR